LKGNVILNDQKLVENLEDGAKKLLYFLSELIGKDINLFYSTKNKIKNKKIANSFCIHIFSSPVFAIQKTQQRINRLFGIRLGGNQSNSKQHSSRGNFIQDFEGQIAGEINGNNIYILFDLIHGNSQELLLYLFFQKYLEIKCGNLLEKFQRYEIDSQKNKYVTICQRRISESIRDSNNEINKIQKEIKSSQQRITELVQKLTPLQISTQFLEENKSQKIVNIERDFEKIQQMEDVRNIIIYEDRISIFTNPIYIDYEDEEYYIGNFLMEIFINGSNGGVMCRNLNNRRGEYDHPHVSGGSCCFGNITDAVSKLIGEGEFVPLIIVMIKFLKSVNPGNWHENIEKWG